MLDSVKLSSTESPTPFFPTLTSLSSALLPIFAFMSPMYYQRVSSFVSLETIWYFFVKWVYLFVIIITSRSTYTWMIFRSVLLLNLIIMYAVRSDTPSNRVTALACFLLIRNSIPFVFVSLWSLWYVFCSCRIILMLSTNHKNHRYSEKFQTICILSVILDKKRTVSFNVEKHDIWWLDAQTFSSPEVKLLSTSKRAVFFPWSFHSVAFSESLQSHIFLINVLY